MVRFTASATFPRTLEQPLVWLLQVRVSVATVVAVDVAASVAVDAEAVAKVLPYCDEARFFDNYNGFVEVAEYYNGELIVKGSPVPAWVEELRDYLG